MKLHKLIQHPEGSDPITILGSLLEGLDTLTDQTFIITHDSSLDLLPALWGNGIKHFLIIGDPVKAVELTSLLRDPALTILGNQFSALFIGGSEKAEVVLMEKLFTGSSPEYLELLEDMFPSMLSQSLTRMGMDTATIECLSVSLPSQRLARRLSRYLKGVPPDAFKHVEEARKLGLGPADMAAYTLSKCLSENSKKAMFIGLSEWGLLTTLPR